MVFRRHGTANILAVFASGSEVTSLGQIQHTGDHTRNGLQAFLLLSHSGDGIKKSLSIVYDAGYSPICPMLYLPLFLNDAVPEEHKSGIDMGRDLLRRSRVLVVCGSYVNVAVKNDIAVAQRLGITATTLDGILTVKGQRRR